MAQAPSYVAYYGMQIDPFSDLQEPPFINVGGRQQAVDSVLHLLSWSEDLIFVSGPPASGKSRLLDQIVRQLDPSIDLAVVDVDECGSEKLLLWELASQFGLEPERSLSTQGLQQLIAAHSAAVQSNDRIPTIAIDDIDQLPVEVLAGLASLLQGGVAAARGLRLVGLAGDVSDVRREMAALGFASGQLLELPALSFDDALHLIQGYFHAAGVRSGVPLEESVLARLHRLSDGRPGAFIDGVRDYMLVEAQRRRRRFSLPWPHLLAGLAVLIVLAVAVLYQSLDAPVADGSAATPGAEAAPNPPGGAAGPGADNLSGAIDTLSPVTGTGISTAGSTGARTSSTSKNPESPLPATRSPDALDKAASRAGEVRARLDAALAERASTTTEDADTATADRAQKAPEATQARADSTPDADNRGANRGANSAADASTDNQAQAPTEPSPLYAPAWLRTAAAGHYTIQLVAARAEENVLQFAEDSSLATDELGYVAGELDGSPWYTLVYGNYPSADAARQAINELAAQVRTAAPWPRTIGSVQADLP